ncbi:MAG TPA: type IV pilus biogenesis/stability protein PilW [Usitatibacter sp.]|jgi:type IV pilus assembly protein PilF|nr:type IV pilus biogenesis/stability protein PilW [Usitatibacter sp.]
MRILLATVAFLAAACTSQSTVESHPVTDSTAADATRRAQVHTALAGEYFARGNFRVALDETRLAVKDDGNYMPAYNMQGLVYMELREDVPAREAFDHALRLAPNNPEVLNNFGWFLCTRGDSDRAVDMLKRATADPMNPTPEKAMLSLGLCYRRMNRNADAEQSLRRAVMIRPELIGALYNLAILTYERGAYDDADNYLNRYMRIAQPNLDGLVLGVKIARARHDAASEDSYLQVLRRRYPDARETQELTQKK